MDNLQRLAQLSIENYPYCDQAFYLSQLLQSGYPVAEGFVVPGDVLWQYLEVLGSSETLLADLRDSDLYLDIHQPQQLRDIAQKLRQKILQGNPPPSWLEALSSYLAQIPTPLVELKPFFQHKEFPAPKAMLEPIVCLNRADAVLSGLQEAWGQLFRARHLFCWRQGGVKLSQLSLAVLVQPLGDAIASGVVTASSGQLEIESTWGLPLAIHRGEVLPDRYGVNPQNGALLHQHLGSKTRAYHLDSAPTAPSPVTTCLLTSEEQQSHSLTKGDLAALTQVCQQLQQAISRGGVLERVFGGASGSNFTLAWQIVKPRDNLAMEAIAHLAAPNLADFEINGLSSYTPPESSSSSPLLNPEESNFSGLRITAFNPHRLSGAVQNTLLPLKGLAVVGGEVTAPAQVILNPRLLRSPNQGGYSSTLDLNISLLGKILVAEVVLPEWLPFLQEAVGIITEQGGMTSHGAIIARELGIPAVVGVAGATKLIRPGEVLLLDGNQGTIQRFRDPQLKENTSGLLGSYTSVTSSDQTSESFLLPVAITQALSGEGLQDGETADLGNVTLANIPPPPGATGRFLARKLQQKLSDPKANPRDLSNDPLAELPRITELLVNLSQARGIKAAASLPVDGVGLLRSEFILTEILQQHNLHTFQDLASLSLETEPITKLGTGPVDLRLDLQQRVITALAEVITEFAEGFAPRPVFYRSADWRSAEFPALFRHEPPETNPVLGCRGTYLYTQNPQLFDWELAALRQVQLRGQDNLRLLLPFVRTVEEFEFCRQRVEQAGLCQQSQFQLWIMAEVPSVIFLLGDFVRAGVQGISIGSNDLTQLILGCDRNQSMMTKNLNESHPAVRAALKQLITTAKQLQIPCSICGQAPVNYPELIEQLVAWGITSISVEATAVETVHRAIVKAEHKLLLDLVQNLHGDSTHQP